MSTNGGYCNADLVRERQNCPFDQLEITYLLDGGKDKTLERRALGEAFFPFLVYLASSFFQQLVAFLLGRKVHFGR